MSLKHFSYALSEDIIEEIADYIVNNYRIEDYDKIYVIFSGKRPSLFLKKKLAEKLKKSYFSPNILSIEDFIYEIFFLYKTSNIISELNAIYLLYKLILEKGYFKNLKFKNFVNFVSWGAEIFSFLEQLMLEDIDDSKLTNIENLAKIGFDIPPNINLLLKDIKEIKKNFYLKLLNKKVYTRGMIYKTVSQEVLNADLEIKEIIFVTPFYLHKTELDLLNNLITKYEVTIFFQGHEEEWKQLNKIAKRFNIKIVPDKKDEIPENIYFYSTFDRHSEINCLNKILRQIPKEEINNTVVVLPDDETATVLLNALPENIEEFNLVCGYPIKHSILYSLLNSIFNAQLTKKGDSYYSKHYFDVLKNHLIINLDLGVDGAIISKIVETLELINLGIVIDEKISRNNFIKLELVEKSKVLYENIFKFLSFLNIPLDKNTILSIIKELHKLLFNQWEDVKNFADFSRKLKTLLDKILYEKLLSENTFILKAIEKVYEICDNLENSLFAEEQFSKEDIFKLFLNELEKTKLSFSGSPLRGLQILGFYETRNLKFDNVIILDLNEGILPYIKIKNAFMPREVLINLGIDRIEIEEEIQRYHFWRMITAAKKVYMIYIESTQKERSRFVEQIIWLKQKQNSTIQYSNLFNCYFKVNLNITKTEIKKTEEVINYLRKATFSATMIDTYLQCPIKFYFSHVLHLSPIKEVAEEAEGGDIGQFVHSLLYEVFKKYQNSLPNINEDFKNNFFKLFEKKFDKELKKLYKTESYMVSYVMKYILDKFLEYEKERLITDKIKKIVALEKEFVDKIKLANVELNFKFIVDRLDETLDDVLLVIDYKTGYVPQLNSLTNFEKTTEYIRSKINSFQLPLYVYIIEKTYQSKKVNAMLYNIRNPEESKILFKDMSIKEDIQNKYFEALDFIISEIFDINKPFYADTIDERKCEICEYKYMCR